MNPNAQQSECIVIGAGISGLMCAAVLKSAGIGVKVLDKARGVGGRMATRRIDEYRFDHGAQSIEQGHGSFAAMMRPWLADGLIHECPPGALLAPVNRDERGPVYCSPGGMTTLPKHLARDLDIELGCRVTDMKYVGGGWRLLTDAGRTLEAKAVILTSPVPQTLEILGGEARLLKNQEIAGLAQVSYEPCIALMAIYDSAPMNLAGISIPACSPIARIVDNFIKGVSESPGAITIHAAAEFSREHFENADDIARDLLLAELKSLTGRAPSLTRVHRWRYSRVTRGLAKSHLLVNDPAPVGFAGDAFAWGSIEGAAVSGVSAAEALLTTLRSKG